MANSKAGWIVAAMIILVLGGMFLQNKYDIFSVVPYGQFNYNAQCTFITNSNPIDAAWNQYQSPEIWISVDADNNGVKEAYTYSGPYSGALPGLGVCGRGAYPTGSLYIENYNQMGDDIYKYYYAPRDSWRIYLCNLDGTRATEYRQDKVNYLDATLTCDLEQANSCSYYGLKRCTPTFGNNAFQSCNSYQRWGAVERCGAGLYCNNGACTNQVPESCANGQTRACTGGTQTCAYNQWGECISNIPLCTSTDYQFSLSPNVCPSTGTQTRIYTKVGNCQGGVSQPANQVVTCTYNPSCTPVNTCQALTCSGSTCTNNCGTVLSGTKDCSINPPTATCSDGIKNGAETGIDCGGSCGLCEDANDDLPVTCTTTQMNLFSSCVDKTLFWVGLLVIVGLIIVMVVKK